jgi:hypothetical protein
MTEWKIGSQEYLERLAMNLAEFEDRLQLPNLKTVTKVIPLRGIKKVLAPPIAMSKEMLLYLIRRIKTMDGQLAFPEAQIQIVKIDPRHLKIGQKFAYRENYQELLETVPNLFHRYCATNGGLADLGAYFIFGLDENNEHSLACYVPPLIEKHWGELVIMDGIHRDFIFLQAGSTLNAILIDKIEANFPCGPHDWSDIKVISLKDKPKNIDDRYFELEKGLFRDLKHLGIDG